MQTLSELELHASNARISHLFFKVIASEMRILLSITKHSYCSAHETQTAIREPLWRQWYRKVAAATKATSTLKRSYTLTALCRTITAPRCANVDR